MLLGKASVLVVMVVEMACPELLLDDDSAQGASCLVVGGSGEASDRRVAQLEMKQDNQALYNCKETIPE